MSSSVPPAPAQPHHPEVEHQVAGLLRELTLGEKIAMLHQHSPGVPRLGIAPFRTGTEALHGVAWLGEATVFPQAVGLGATWDPDLVRRVGEATSVEVRAKHAKDPSVSLNVWAPVVNPLRDPRWGRNEEGYAEDPLLVSRLAIAFCRGLRGDHPTYVRTTPTLKHFLAYNNETERTVTSSTLRPRVLHEYDLPVFREPIRAGVVDAVMPSYNLVNGRPNHVSPYLNEFLRRWTDQELLVVSDAEAPSNLVESEHYFDDHPVSHAAALRAGVDSFTDHSADPSFTVERFTRALEQGLITEEDVDRAVRRVLTIRARTGEFAGEEDPHAAIGEDALARPEHRQLALEAAREQIVLLKNEAELLPLDTRSGLRVAVVGPFAAQLCEDWYSGTMPYRVTVAEGLRAVLQASRGSVLTSEGTDRIALSVGGGAGAVTAAPDGRVAVSGSGPRAADDPAAHFDVFCWGETVLTLRNVVTGRYLTTRGEARELAADAERPGGWDVLETFRLVPQDDDTVVLQHVHSGAFVTVDATGTMAAGAVRPEDAERFTRQLVMDGRDEARRLAGEADVAVVVVGNDPHINGRETQDRGTLDLPSEQDALLRTVAAVTPRVVLVVMSSYPYALTWAQDNVPAILWTSHAGQETGHAVADVLFGEHAPTGRLPQTWYHSTDDLPDPLEYDIIKARWTYQYFGGAPLYPFGHGLTYTTFRYGEARLTRTPETVTVTVEVTNTGSRAAVEVVQLYTRALGDRPDRPVRRLQAFARVALAPGRTAPVVLEFPVAQLAHWDVARHALEVEPSRYEVLVGRSCQAIETTTEFEVPGPPDEARGIVGVDVAAVDFDDCAGVSLVDTVRERGEAVASGSDADGWLLFRRVTLTSDLSRVTARVSRAEPGEAQLEFRTDDPVTGPLLGRVTVPSTGDRYRWTNVSAAAEAPPRRQDPTTGAPVGAAPELRDLYLVLRGSFRLDTVRLDTVRLDTVRLDSSRSTP